MRDKSHAMSKLHTQSTWIVWRSRVQLGAVWCSVVCLCVAAEFLVYFVVYSYYAASYHLHLTVLYLTMLLAFLKYTMVCICRALVEACNEKSLALHLFLPSCFFCISLWCAMICTKSARSTVRCLHTSYVEGSPNSVLRASAAAVKSIRQNTNCMLRSICTMHSKSHHNQAWRSTWDFLGQTTLAEGDIGQVDYDPSQGQEACPVATEAWQVGIYHHDEPKQSTI